MALALAGACAPDACAAGAAGTGWEAVTAQGLRLAIGQDPALGREGYVLVRRYPDGAPDRSFGDAGVAFFRLGPDNEGPTVVRLDALGRPWVAGASVGSDGRLQAVLLRWLPDGRPDPAFGRDGRVEQAPAGRQARATDLLPLAGGGAMVAGLVTDGGDERVGWWRVDDAGRVDPRFGLGGLWLDPQPTAGEPAGFAADADGTLRLRVRRGDGAATAEQAWALAPGDAMPRAAAPGQPASTAPRPMLVPATAMGSTPALSDDVAKPPPAVAASGRTGPGGAIGVAPVADDAAPAAPVAVWAVATGVGAVTAAFGLGAWRRRERRRRGRRG